MIRLVKMLFLIQLHTSSDPEILQVVRADNNPAVVLLFSVFGTNGIYP